MADYKMNTEWGPDDKNLLVGKLIQGKGFANKLKDLIQNPVQDDYLYVTDSAQQLVMNMLTSFSDAISVLTSCDDDSDEFRDQIQAVGSTCSGDRASSACSGQSRKRPDRRGCYKRRKTSDSRIKVAPTSEDEYAWRKYGQKEILNSKHPRCYYRCTHKKDQGCKALKQVQKLEDGSNMYHITYFSHHTCKNLVKTTQIFQEPLNSYLLSFESKRPNTSGDNYPCSGPTKFVPLVKEEPNKQEQCEVLSDKLSAVDSNLWKEIIAIGSSDEVPLMMGFDHDDVMSSSVQNSSASASSYHDLDMDFWLKSVDFYSEFPFGEME